MQPMGNQLPLPTCRTVPKVGQVGGRGCSDSDAGATRVTPPAERVSAAAARVSAAAARRSAAGSGKSVSNVFLTNSFHHEPCCWTNYFVSLHISKNNAPLPASLF